VHIWRCFEQLGTLDPMRLIAVLLCIGVAEQSFAAEKPTVVGVLLPSRGAASAERAANLTKRLSEKWNGVLETAPPHPDLAARLERARALASSGHVDEAANVYDAALEDGARAIAQTSGGDFVRAHVQRAAIALARGENERGRALLARLLSYDPTFALLPNERSPQLVDALEAARGSVRRGPEVMNEAAQSACHSADVLVLFRARGDGQLDMARYDRCAIVGSASGTDDELIRALESPRPQLTHAVQSRPRDRAKVIGGIVTLSLSLGLLVTGTYFAADAAQDRENLNHGCSPTMTCTSDELSRRYDQYHLSTTLAATLSAVGAAGLIAGGLVIHMGTRSSPKTLAFAIDRSAALVSLHAEF
jgi:hypothetical protein